eukprot:Awhi_evm1s4789
MNAKDLVFAIFRQLKDEQKRELLPYPTVAGLTHLMAAVEEKIKKSTEPSKSTPFICYSLVILGT